MKPKKIELLLLLILVSSMILCLLDYQWIQMLLYVDFFCLLILWILGYVKRDKFQLQGFTKSEFWERLILSPIVIGVVLNISLVSHSTLFITLGFVIVIPFYLMRGIKTIIRKDIITGIEMIFISIILTGFFLRLRHYPGGSPLRVYFMCSLQILYLILSIRYLISFVKQKNQPLGIIGMILYWIISVFLNAILLDAMFWPGNLSLFWIAIISSIIALPIYFVIKSKNRELTDILKFQDDNLIKRFVIISCISIVFAVATPKQFLRLDYGNRPHIIEAYYNCYLNNNIDELTKEKNCNELHQLDVVLRSGHYREGISDDDLQLIKKELNKK